MPSQLTLPLGHEPHYGLDHFIAAPSNKAALRLVEIWPDWPSPVVVLSGPPGSGKTHLTHVWAERAGADILQASGLEAGALVRPTGPLAVEDIAMDAVPEQGLFHLINGVGEAGTHLLITSRSLAAEWRVGLADLRSRLRLATPVAVESPDEDLLRKVLIKLFADRQLFVDKPVVDYLLLRMERSLGAALVLVEALDGQALATGSPITRAMAAKILAEAAATQEFSGSN